LNWLRGVLEVATAALFAKHVVSGAGVVDVDANASDVVEDVTFAAMKQVAL
jgi:hypothetical protein